MSNKVNHPTHYNSNSTGIETIEIVRKFGFNTGNAWKYLSRFRFKGTATEDLNKAVWYLRDLMANVLSECSGLISRTCKNPDTVDKMKAVINAEQNIYVRNALELIANYETYGNECFKSSNTVIDQLEAHIADIIEEEQAARGMSIASQFLDESSEETTSKDLDRNSIETINLADLPPFVDEDEEAERKARLERFNDNGAVSCESVYSVYVNNKTKQVMHDLTELKNGEEFHTELVQVPDNILAKGPAVAQKYAESVVLSNLINQTSVNTSLAESMQSQLGDAVKHVPGESGWKIEASDVEIPDEKLVKDEQSAEIVKKGKRGRKSKKK